MSETRGSQVPVRPRGRPRRASARPAIVAATLDLLAERDFQATTIEAIAARAGVGRNTIYRRWSSKEELIADALSELAVPGPAGDGDLYALLRRYLRDQERAFSDPRVGRLLPGLLGELERNPQFALAWSERVVRPRRQAIVETLERALGRGELRPGADPELIADLLIGPPFLRLLFPLGLPEVPKSYAEDLLATIWQGIAPVGDTPV
jgi:AcrR family transcriptional regulator